ncbi:MAG: 4-hydroxy-tetrahydrodipicolinate synthase [Flavobacteriales bacterium]|nr:MAG: 4-hydroxy-tetrahydrodipicolinate synthase [Flavobacteriales bacterium]
MSHKFKGTGVAIVTPFKEDESIDYPSLEKFVEHLISGGIDYLVVQGTTGESVTMTKEEKSAMLDFVVEITKNRLPIVLGIGGSNTKQVVSDFGNFNLENVDAILSASPAYNKPTQEGIYQHYKTIAENTEKPIILYNVPGRTASNITAETTLRLANDCKNIIAIKEASNDLRQIMDIIQNKPDGFLVISGDDGLTLPIVSLGADGVISVVANAFPKEFSAMVNAALQNNYEAAQVEHYKLIEIIDLLFAEGNPGGIKAALKILGITGDKMRLPLVSVSEELYQKLEEKSNQIT